MPLNARADRLAGTLKLTLMVACFALLSACILQPSSAYAYDTNPDGAYAKVSCEGSNPRSFYCHSVEDTVNAVKDMVSSSRNPYEVDDVTIDLMQDWDTNSYGVLKFEGSSKHYTVNLHGHMINRDIANPDSSNKFSGKGNGEVIRVCEGSELTIVGSTEGDESEASLSHPGRKIDLGDDGVFWKFDSSGADGLAGGLITGGACDDSLGGGGFTVQEEATLTLKRVTVAGNVADTYGSSYGCGAGICQAEESSVYLIGSKVQYNHAEGWGGGVYNDVGADLYLSENASIEWNTAEKYGGGIALDPGESWGGKVKVKDASISHNIAKKSGGGIYDDGSALRKGGYTFEFTRTSISYNTSGGDGGGLAVSCDYNMGIWFRNCQVDHNKAAESGGGIWFDCHWQHMATDDPLFAGSSSSLSFNEAGGNGGGLYVNNTNYVGAESTIENVVGTVTIEGNKATGTQGGSYGNGGAVAIDETDKISAVAFGKGTVFKNNTAANHGGAIWVSDDADADLTSVDGKGGLIFEGNSASAGGAIYESGGKSRINIFSKDNKTSFTKNHADTQGGAIFVSTPNDYTTSIVNAEFAENYAGSSTSTTGAGGAIWFDRQLNISNTKITDNYATGHGGGVYCGNSDSQGFTLGGTVLIDGNSVAGIDSEGNISGSKTRNNLSIKSSQKINGASGSNAVTEDSSIGVTVEDYAQQLRQLTGNVDFVTQKLESVWSNCLYSDDTDYSVIRNGNYLYLSNLKTTGYSLVAYGASNTQIDKIDPGATATLNSSNFVKKTKDSAGNEYEWTLVSWSVTSKGKTTTVKPDSNGISSITVDAPTTARANYACAVKKLGISLGDIYRYDKLESSDTPEKGDTPVYKTALSLDYIDSTSKVIEHPETADALYVKSKKVEEKTDDQGQSIEKKVTYTIQIPESTLSSNNLFAGDAPALDFKVNFNKYSKAGSTDGLGEFSSTELSEYTVTDDGDIEFKVSVTVPYEPAEHTVTLIANKMSEWYKFPDGHAEKQIKVEDGQLLVFGEDLTPINTGDTAAEFENWWVYDKASKKYSPWYCDEPVTDDITLIAGFFTPPISGQVKVTFKSGDSIIGATNINENSAVEQPSDPAREGYTFEGWYADADYKTKYSFDTKLTEDTTIYAKLVHKPCTVTFDYNYSTSQTVDEEVAYGDYAKGPVTPTWEGHKFLGWYLGASKFDLENTKITKDITLTAKWEVSSYTVSFNTGEGASKIEDETVRYGECAEQPADPTWAGHIFAGWYADKDCSTEFDFANTTINNDTVVYAKWDEAYKVTLKFENGDDDEVRTVKKGDTLDALPVPSYEGHSFVGWYDKDGNKVEDNAEVNGDMTLTAKWELNTYTVTFNKLNGSDPEIQQVKFGSTAEKIADPELEGYIFEGWYRDKACSEDEKFEFDQTITGDLNLYAKWKADMCTVSFDSAGGTEVEPVKVQKGTSLGTLPVTTKEGFKFAGWYNGDQLITAETPITGNLELVAHWVDPTASCTVTFKDGDSIYLVDSVKAGESAAEPAAPTKDGYVFKGWLLDGTAYDFASPVTSDITLEASWEAGSSDDSGDAAGPGEADQSDNDSQSDEGDDADESSQSARTGDSGFVAMACVAVTAVAAGALVLALCRRGRKEL